MLPMLKIMPSDLSELLQAMATDFPVILHGKLVGIYFWGSLTYDVSMSLAATSIALVSRDRTLMIASFLSLMSGSRTTTRNTDGLNESICASSSTANFWTRRHDAAASITTKENSPAMDRTETQSFG